MPESIYERFRACCATFASKPMIYQPVDSNYLIKTYGEVFAEVQALIAHLKGLDLGPGSKVGLLSENRYEWLVAYCAASASGLVVVPLDPRLSPLEWTTILNHAEASLLFFSENFSAQALELSVTVPSLRRRIGWGPSIVNNDVQDSLSEIVKAGAADTVGPLPNSSGDSIASLIYTSGTTGIPKGVLLSQSNILHNAARMRRRGDRPGKMTLMILPLNHIYGFIGFLANVLYGQSVILFSKIDVRVILKTLQDLRPQHVAGVPAFYENIGKTIRKQLAEKLPKSLVPYLKGPAYRALGREPTSLRSLKKILFKKVHDTFGGRIEYLSSGGAPLEPRLARLFNLLGLPILEGYGLTETTSVVSANDLGSAHYRLGSVGKVCADSEVMVLNPDPSGVGEICVKGPAVMQGYYKNVEDTAAVFETEGWFKTGDLGCLDSDGFLFVTGRSKDVIVTPNGKKIFPDEVQSRLGDLPFVKEFVIFGIPLSEGSRAEKIHIQIVPDQEAAAGIEDLENQIKKSVLEKSRKLPEHIRPQSFGFSPSAFPRTTTLKVKKNIVKQEFLGGKKEPSTTPAAAEAPMEGAIASPLLKLIEAQLPEKVQIRASSSLSLDLGFDSLTMLDFWNSVQERFRVSIPEETTRELREVGAILQYLQSLPELQGSDFSVDQAFPDGNPQAGLAGILSNPPPEIHQATQEILDSHPRLRPWFLKAFRIFFRGACRLRVQGLENLPAQGPYILAPNHESYLDNIFVACLLPKAAQDDIAVIGAKEFFDKPATRLIAQLCRTIPIEREKFSHAILQMGLDILQRGKILLVHPEGTRSPNGQLLPLKAGVGILASFQGCPVVPVHVEGGYEFWPKDSKFPKSRGPILVSIGKPLMPMRDPTQAKGMDLMESAQDLTRRLRASLISLSEQALVSTKNNSGPEAAGKPLEISEIPSRPRGDL